MNVPRPKRVHPLAAGGVVLAVASWVGGPVGLAAALLFAGYVGYAEIHKMDASRQIGETMKALARGEMAPDLGPLPDHMQPLAEIVDELREVFATRDRELREAIQRERLKTLDLEMFADRLEESGQKLREVNDELEAFAYSASHDMAAPLRVIEGLSSILIEDVSDDLDEDARAHLDTIKRSAERLLALLQDLLVLSRVRAPSRDDVKRVEVGNLVSSIAKDRKPDLPEKATILIGGSLPTVEAPPERLRQVLENLITNGFKYNDSDQPVVSIDGWTEGSIGVIRVEDNGIGIPEHLQDSCFGLFTRLHSDRDTPGTGAGLAIARRAVRSLGGELWIEGSSEHGTTFVIAVPTYFTTDLNSIQWNQLAGLN